MPGTRGPYYGWVLALALGITTIVSYGTTQYLFGLLLVPIQHETGWSRGAISGAFSLGLLVTGILGLPVGALIDRRGARLLMSAGSLLGGAGLLLLAQVHQVWQFYGVWAGCLGLAMALTFYPVSFTVMTNWFHRRRGTAMAVLTLVGGLASPIFVPLAGLLISRVGWRGAVTVLALTQLAVALPLHAVLLRRHPEDIGLQPDGAGSAGDEPARPPGFSLRAALGRVAFWTLTMASGLSLLASGVLLAHQVAYMIGRGFDPVLAASAAGLVGLASLPGRLVFNLLSDRFGPQGLLAICALTQALGTALLAMATGPLLLWAYVIVYGAAFGAISPLRGSVLAEQFGRQSYGAILAAQGLPVAALAAVGPLLAGILYDRLASYEVALWLTAGAFVVAAVAVWLTPRPAVPLARPSARAPAAADA